MQAIGMMTLTATRPTTSPRPSRSPSTPVTWCPASTSPTTRCCRRGSSPTSTPSSPGSAARTSTRSRSTGRTRRSTTCCATASTSTPSTPVSRPTARTRSTAAARSSPARTMAPSSRRPWRSRARGRAAPRRPTTTTSARSACSGWLTPVEQDHIVSAYTFELAKCYEEVIRERQLLALANIDPSFASGWPRASGRPAPEATEPLGGPAGFAGALAGGWVVAGRRPHRWHRRRRRPDAAGVAKPGDVKGEGLLPLVIGPHGGTLADGIAVQRTFGTADPSSSTPCWSPPARRRPPDAVPTRRCQGRRTGGDTARPPDPCYSCTRPSDTRRPWAAGGTGKEAITDAGLPLPEEAGVVTGLDGSRGLDPRCHELMSQHRAWEQLRAGLRARRREERPPTHEDLPDRLEPVPDPRALRRWPRGPHLRPGRRAAPARARGVALRGAGVPARVRRSTSSTCRRTGRAGRPVPTSVPRRTSGWTSTTPTWG